MKDSLQLFEEENLFFKRKVSNMVFFKPNMQNDSLLKMFEYLELERREKFYSNNKQITRLLKKYTENLLKLSNNTIQIILLFGSVARGEWTKNSDIDILVVVYEKMGEALTILSKTDIVVSPLLKVSPISTTTAKFIEGVNKKTEFYEELLRDRIVLFNEFMFWQLIRDGGKQHA